MILPHSPQRGREFGFDFARQIQGAAVNGDHQGQVAPARRHEADPGEPVQGVRVDDIERIVHQLPVELEGHDVAAPADELFPLLVGDAQDGDERVKALHFDAGIYKRILLPLDFEAGTIYRGGDALRAQPIKQTQHGGLRTTPFQGVVFAKNVSGMHGQSSKAKTKNLRGL